MNIERLPSGKYRIRQMHKGRMYSVTVPYKPTKMQALELMQDKMNHKTSELTFGQACDKYLQAKSNVLSQSTIRGYRSMIRNIPEQFKALDLSEIDNYILQSFINEYSVDHAPKSVTNMNGLVCAIIAFFVPQAQFHIKLPQKRACVKYCPTVDDIKRILEHSKDSNFYVPLYLATLGLRLSEICALDLSDLEGNQLTINKAKIRAEDKYIIKPTPKTDASNRIITIPQELSDIIHAQGHIYPFYPPNIEKYLDRTLKKLNIPHFGVHDLRHFFASYSHELGYSDAVIQSIGGWSTDHVMKSVYRHAMNVSDAKSQVAKDFRF